MKKVLSVALASAMVLGMGVNAFADISYNTGAGVDNIDLEAIGLTFDGGLVIADKTGVAIDTTKEDEEFRPGDVVYMPLYAQDQLKYDGGYKDGVEALPRVTKTYKIAADTDSATGRYNRVEGVKDAAGNDLYLVAGTPNQLYVDGGSAVTQLKYDGELRDIESIEWKAGDANVVITLKARAASSSTNADDVVDGRGYGPYTGEIGKNWSINFTEKSDNYVEKASFYRATSKDEAKLGLDARAWYIKVELKDLFDSVADDEVYYKVYVSDNNTRKETNRVYVKGTLSNEDVKYVDFEWTNNANVPAVWHVKKGENGTAVFDFEDKAFFTVKMYSEEKMYLDLSTAFQKAVANEYDAEFDDFFKFQGTNANFSRTGELIIESNDPNLFVYEIDSDNNLYPVDAKYVKDYQITHTNDKINGYVFNTKTLGNYVLSVDELEVEEDEAPATEAPEEKPAADKENPNTGANDFVGVAVALAVVSVAGAGALALKK